MWFNIAELKHVYVSYWSFILLLCVLITINRLLFLWIRTTEFMQRLVMYLNEKCKETGKIKNERAILLQVQCIHTAFLFWHTHRESVIPHTSLALM